MHGGGAWWKGGRGIHDRSAPATPSSCLLAPRKATPSCSSASMFMGHLRPRKLANLLARCGTHLWGCIGGRGSPRRGLRRPSSVRRQRWGGPCIVVKHARWLWPPSFSVLIHSLRKHSSEKKVLAGHTGFEFSYLFALVLSFFACFYPPGDRQSPAGFTNRQGALPLIKCQCHACLGPTLSSSTGFSSSEVLLCCRPPPSGFVG